MKHDDDELTLAEKQMLQKLDHTAKLLESLIKSQSSRREGSTTKDTELISLRQELALLKDENKHLKETLNKCKKSMNNLIDDLK